MTEIVKTDYRFPRFSGCFTGKLILKEKSGKCMMLYFDNLDSKSKLSRYVLPVWSTGSDSYELSGVEFATLPIDTVCKCSFEIVKTEKGQQTKVSSVNIVSTAQSCDLTDVYARQFFIMLIKRAFPRCLTANLVIRKYLDDNIYLSAWDNSINTCYEVTKKAENWQIRRFKTGDKSEKDTIVTIDYRSYDVLTKDYK